jgi:hypothetical protein
VRQTAGESRNDSPLVTETATAFARVNEKAVSPSIERRRLSLKLAVIEEDAPATDASVTKACASSPSCDRSPSSSPSVTKRRRSLEGDLQNSTPEETEETSSKRRSFRQRNRVVVSFPQEEESEGGAPDRSSPYLLIEEVAADAVRSDDLNGGQNDGSAKNAETPDGESVRAAKLPSFVVIREIPCEGVDAAEQVVAVEEDEEGLDDKVIDTKAGIRIEVTCADGCTDSDERTATAAFTDDSEAWSRGEEEAIAVTDDPADGRNSQATIPEGDDVFDTDEREKPWEAVKEADLELISISSSSSDGEEDEFEALRLRRLQAQRSEAPERDIAEEDTETAEFQSKLRRLSSSSSATQVGS